MRIFPPFRSCLLLSLLITFWGGDLSGQKRVGPYAPPAGQSGTTAMYKDSAAFVAWASSCAVRRGPKDTSDLSKGYASAGSPSNATGKAGANGVVSLGDHGHATLEFPKPIQNGPGPDFAVFENSFNDSFLELGFVEVSSNGKDFFRFPAVSLTDTSDQVGSFGDVDATNLYNLAGKYRQGYGTPFDLDELPADPDLNVDSITEIRIVDAIGCIQDAYATYDSTGRAVNDPWPTDFNSGGFDLDAVGVVHQRELTELESTEDRGSEIQVRVSEKRVRVEGFHETYRASLFDLSGRLLFQSAQKGSASFRLPSSIERGVHVLRLEGEQKTIHRKVFIR